MIKQYKARGFTQIDNSVLERLALMKLSSIQHRIICVVLRYTCGFHRKEHNLSLQFLSNATGYDKRQLQRELKKLEDRKIVNQIIQGNSTRIISINENLDEWGDGKSKGNGDGNTKEITNMELGTHTNLPDGRSTGMPNGSTTNQEIKFKDISINTNKGGLYIGPTKQYDAKSKKNIYNSVW